MRIGEFVGVGMEVMISLTVKCRLVLQKGVHKTSGGRHIEAGSIMAESKLVKDYRYCSDFWS